MWIYRIGNNYVPSFPLLCTIAQRDKYLLQRILYGVPSKSYNRFVELFSYVIIMAIKYVQQQFLNTHVILKYLTKFIYLNYSTNSDNKHNSRPRASTTI